MRAAPLCRRRAEGRIGAGGEGPGFCSGTHGPLTPGTLPCSHHAARVESGVMIAYLSWCIRFCFHGFRVYWFRPGGLFSKDTYLQIEPAVR